MKSIMQREKELFYEAWNLRNASFEVGMQKGTKQDKYNKSKELQKQQNEVWKKQQFFMKYLKEMEKRKND